MTRVVLRVDDICATTAPADLHRVYDPCWDRDLPVCLSVIPRSAYRFTWQGPEPAPIQDLQENRPLCDFLVALNRAGLVEIALHGWEHRYGELAEGSDADIDRRIGAGLAALREALPGVAVRVLVPPHDYLSPAGLRAARRRRLILCSTWAACHGGTRWSHGWARLHRLVGVGFPHTIGGDWYSEATVLDFDGPEFDDLPATRRLVNRRPGRDMTVVLTQHFWRLLDRDGAPNARHARWLAWLAWAFDGQGMEFARYADG